METFGNFIKKTRIEKRITLRNFCLQAGVDPSNWSKIERGILNPPKSKLILKQVARVFDFKEGSEDYNNLFDLAIISFVPREIADEEVLNKLPVFFRTIRGEAPTEEELKNLIKQLQEK